MSYGKLKTITLAFVLIGGTGGFAFAQDSSSSTANVNVGVGVTASNTSNSERQAPGQAGLGSGSSFCTIDGVTVSFPGFGLGVQKAAKACDRGHLAFLAGAAGVISPTVAERTVEDALIEMGGRWRSLRPDDVTATISTRSAPAEIASAPAKQREAAFKARAAARAPTTAGKAAANLPDSIKLDITGVGKVKIVDQAAIAAYYSCDVIRVQGARVRQPGCSS